MSRACVLAMAASVLFAPPVAAQAPAPTFARDVAPVVFARCTRCHPPAAYLVPRAADVGTGGLIDVPGLRGLSGRAPYGHDGRWASLEDAVLAMLRHEKLELSFDERLQLQEYLKLL